MTRAASSPARDPCKESLRGFAEVDRPVTAEEALRDLISGLGVEQWHIPDGRQAMAGLYRTLLRNRRVLIVLDDARSIDQVVDLLPARQAASFS